MSYAFKPVSMIPSTKCRCAIKYRIVIGRIATTAAAIKSPQSTEYTDRNELITSGIVYFFSSLRKIRAPVKLFQLPINWKSPSVTNMGLHNGTAIFLYTTR